MFEFFKYKPDPKGTYLRAAYFIDGDFGYTFVHWNDKVQEFMNAHLLHVGMGRIDSEIINDGRHDDKYFEDFEFAWQTLMRSVKAEHRDIFREEIDFRPQDREFAFCGTLGREFIPL